MGRVCHLQLSRLRHQFCAETSLLAPLCIVLGPIVNQNVRPPDRFVAKDRNTSDHEVETQKGEAIASQQTLPKWPVIVLAVSVVMTLFWVSWILSLVF
jgi:hypothetical protein